MRIRALIVDDEPPARKKLRHFLKDHPEIEIAGEATDGLNAVQQIETLKPDLVFLDIQMPRMDGFEVLESLQTKRPIVIFTTAYDRHALKAFEVRALDYLLKPFDSERFSEALARVTETIQSKKKTDDQIDELLSEIRSRRQHLHRILLRDSGRIFFLKTNEIHRIESEEKYVRLYTGKISYLHRETMNSLEKVLDPSQFVRVHRRQILNMEFIQELQSWTHGDYIIVMKDGSRIPLGRSYRDHFLRTFQQPPDK
ncbi:LytTR family DNA-binding domain-containing protein [bacterium]|nr:LytTR family DNA-binding domain-containing protein [bacterium]